jgi:hypothetical protein
MTLHTMGYAVERQFPGFSNWTRVEMHYACNMTDSAPTSVQTDKAWAKAFESAQALESMGAKVRISTFHVTSTHTPVWEGR